MTNEEIHAELAECLRLQTELEARRDELTGRFKRILEATRENRQRLITTIDGELYELGRADLVNQTVDAARKHGGFFTEYRLIKLGKPI
jgi:predicted transcriptional regulator